MTPLHTPTRAAALALALALATAAPALSAKPGETDAAAADGAAAAMTYEIFEATVDHADLADCPRELAAEGRFCRLVLHGEALHVFAFAEAGEQPLVAVKDFPVDQLRLGD